MPSKGGRHNAASGQNPSQADGDDDNDNDNDNLTPGDINSMGGIFLVLNTVFSFNRTPFHLKAHPGSSKLPVTPRVTCVFFSYVYIASGRER